MPLVQAWQCPHTGKLFANKPAYQKHLRKLGAKRIEAFKQRKAQETLDEALGDLSKSGSFEQIAEWCMSHAELLLRNNRRAFGRETDWQNLRLYDVEFVDMYWTERCPNTHHAPAGKPTNWGSRDNLPRGYPGWWGRIAFKIEGHRGFSSDIFDQTPIHIGSGGGTTIWRNGHDVGTKCQYEVILFEEEWPMLGMMMKLRGDMD